MAITPVSGWQQIEEISEDNTADTPSLNVVQQRAPTPAVYTPAWTTSMGWMGVALAIKYKGVGGETVELWID